MKLTFEGGEVYDLEPPTLPNLYDGQPIRLYGRYRASGPTKIRVQAEVLGSPLDQTVDLELPATEEANPQIDRMWASHRVQRLMDENGAAGTESNAAEIVRLCEGYSIVSEYASFIVLENDAEYKRWQIERRNVTAAAFSRKAVARVYRLKGRAGGKALSVIVPALDMVRDVAVSLPPGFIALAGELWPGPLTLVLPAAPAVPGFLAGPGRTIAVRIPALPWLRALVRELGEPLTATSANRAGEKEISDPNEVSALFGGRIDLLVDGGPTPGGLPSTIVDLCGGRPRILRQGAIPEARIEALLRG